MLATTAADWLNSLFGQSTGVPGCDSPIFTFSATVAHRITITAHTPTIARCQTGVVVTYAMRFSTAMITPGT